ncbi:hypothetical protein ACFL2A_07510, partial [Thermodesulfobacteriota bacterium]
YTTNITNEHTTSTAPNFVDFSNALLKEDSDAINNASDGFDIGAFLSGPYNVLRTVSDTFSLSEPAIVDALCEPIEDSLIINDNLAEENMNVSIDLMLGGLFHSDKNGDILYITKSAAAAIVDADNFAGWQYDGASLDISYDNPGGDLCEVYIVADDGSSDYTPVSWWVENAYYPAGSSSATSGSKGYAINCTKDAENDLEWGLSGTLSTIAADGVNDQKWEITLKMRVYNVNKGSWSEVATVAKSYYFNDFDKTMYYCADNPRCVNGEYADHVNYYAQIYHSGSNKYTGLDGVDWIDDNRRFAYNPATKIFLHFSSGIGAVDSYKFETPANYGNDRVFMTWQNRRLGDNSYGASQRSKTEQINSAYACLYGNFGDYNYSSAHCFAVNNTQVYDDALANLHTSPFNNTVKPIHYGFTQQIRRSDGQAHSSHRGWIVRLPSGENLANQDFTNFALIDDNDLYFAWEDSQWHPGSYNMYYFHLPDNQTPQDHPSGYVQVLIFHQEIWANTGQLGDNVYGGTWNRASTGTTEDISYNW